MDRRALTRRRRLAALVAAPAVVVALALTGLEAWRLLRPRSTLFAPAFAYSLADAIETGNVQHAYQYIRAGQDPNQLITVRHPVLTGNKWAFASPLDWAAATGQTDAVRMLLGFGARAESSALCLAEALGHQDVVRVLQTHGPDVTAAGCGVRASGEPPLLYSSRW